MCLQCFCFSIRQENKENLILSLGYGIRSRLERKNRSFFDDLCSMHRMILCGIYHAYRGDSRITQYINANSVFESGLLRKRVGVFVDDNRYGRPSTRVEFSQNKQSNIEGFSFSLIQFCCFETVR